MANANLINGLRNPVSGRHPYEQMSLVNLVGLFNWSHLGRESTKNPFSNKPSIF